VAKYYQQENHCWYVEQTGHKGGIMREVQIKNTLRSTAAIAILPLSFALFSRPAIQEGQVEPREFMSHEQFIGNIRKAVFADYAKKPGTKVTNEKEFLRMQNHVLSMYEGVIVKNSFVMERNGFVDCIDATTQPSLRRAGKQLTIQTPPKAVAVEERPQERKGEGVPPMLSREKKDRFGNVMFCESGYIPLRRVTLEELTRFATLDDFFNKFGKAGTSGLPQKK
jgi:hypothetical protein